MSQRLKELIKSKRKANSWRNMNTPGSYYKQHIIEPRVLCSICQDNTAKLLL